MELLERSIPFEVICLIFRRQIKHKMFGKNICWHPMTRERGRDVAVLAMSSYTPVDCPLSSPQSLSVSLSPALLGGGALTHLPTTLQPQNVWRNILQITFLRRREIKVVTHNKMHAGGVADNSGPWNDEKDPFEVIQRYAPSAGFEYNILEIFHLTIHGCRMQHLKIVRSAGQMDLAN